MIVTQVSLSTKDMIDNALTMQQQNYLQVSQQLTKLQQSIL